MKNLKVSAIICAAGKGERAGFSKNKLLTPVAGAPALWHTLKKFDIPEIDDVIVTSSACDFEEISSLCKPFGFKTVEGGKTRTQSVKNALNSVTGDIVLIHDGARPFVKKELILSCIDAVKKYDSGICALKLTDTVVSAAFGQITDRLDRECTYRLQTPQGFYTADIKRAYALAGDKTYTDDSAVYCEFISPARIIDGDEENVKLTFKSDFLRDIPAFSVSDGENVGFGVDVHSFCEGDKVVLGGIEIPCGQGLAAHSDGDVIIHALMDALLSSAGLRDIGHYFPVDDAAYAGADSKELLKRVILLLREKSYAPANISITVQAEKPRLSPYIGKMVEVLSGICNLSKEKVAVSAGTSEKLGFVGEGLGICAYAAVTVKKL
ncbi:MAG: 2-C-methyl-D-erythritol 2,4-cyclodiphosphate synthase [Clostridia bacterium]|nr:2-C-methyl-D-erythritol 2,4-cyclodiphosphate synthase [Clostridia bacterium]